MYIVYNCIQRNNGFDSEITVDIYHLYFFSERKIQHERTDKESFLRF